MSSHEYDPTFYNYIGVGARRSAAVIVSFLQKTLSISSVVDIGCGRGAWIAEWLGKGVPDAVGVDGTYVDAGSLIIPEESFRPRDLSKPFSLGRQFDLVQCLEVGEHIPAEYADVFVDNIVGHGNVILFSAATPGQGGEHHVNEQPLEYWRDKFADRQYRAFDPLRPAIRDRMEVECWYRYNTLLFVREGCCGALSDSVKGTSIPPGAPIQEMAPLYWLTRRAILARLPRHTVTRIAVAKHLLINASRRLRGAGA